MNVLRLLFLAQESPLRRAYEWTILAEYWWPHDRRKLTFLTFFHRLLQQGLVLLEHCQQLGALAGGQGDPVRKRVYPLGIGASEVNLDHRCPNHEPVLRPVSVGTRSI